MIDLNNLYVTQADLRHWDTIFEMSQFVADGGFWTKNHLEDYSRIHQLDRVSPLIAISKFEDGKLYLHDGMHRCTSVWLGNRKYLRDDEYTLTEWTYNSYLEIAPQNNWFTPFDPRTHVRTSDFAKFKKEAKERFSIDPNAAKWLYENSYKFLTIREFNTIAEFLSFNSNKLIQFFPNS
jgi:hypothetical protein